MTPSPLEAVHNLLGLKLPEGWVIVDKKERESTDTGGCFSVSYFVEDSSGKRAFLKALNLAKAMSMQGDQLKNIQKLIEIFNFERDTLDICKKHELTRVASAICHGKLDVPGNPFGVYYIIFELAEGDVRSRLNKIGRLDVVWILRSLHATANGIRELHSKNIAHQDIKPSNVLLFPAVGAKIADLGCADIKGGSSPMGSYRVAGDPSYAPIELLYNEVSPLWERRRLGADMYLFGSLVTFLFAQVTMTSAILNKMHHLHRPGFWTREYSTVLPYVREAYGEVLVDIKKNLPEGMKDELIEVIRFLCDPDPKLRGKRSFTGSEQFSFERVVAILDRVATRAEILARKS